VTFRPGQFKATSHHKVLDQDIDPTFEFGASANKFFCDYLFDKDKGMISLYHDRYHTIQPK